MISNCGMAYNEITVLIGANKTFQEPPLAEPGGGLRFLQRYKPLQTAFLLILKYIVENTSFSAIYLGILTLRGGAERGYRTPIPDHGNDRCAPALSPPLPRIIYDTSS